MQQIFIRRYNGTTYSITEGDRLIDELNKRTQWKDDGYNSIRELGIKLKNLIDLIGQGEAIPPYENTNPSPFTLGSFTEGEQVTPQGGLNINQMFDKFFTEQTLPSISFNVNNQIIEKGTNFSQTININFSQNDAGALIGYSLEKDGIEVSTTQSTSFTANNVIQNFTLQAKVSHAAGDNISAGTISTPLKTISQKFKIFYGAVANIPTNSTEIRALGNDVWDNANQATLQTGTTNTNFVIAIPTSINNSATLQAQDTTNNVGYEFTFDSAVNVVLPNGNNEEYRIYVVTVDNAFGASANIVINL